MGSEILKYISVFCLSTFEVWVAVPLGIAYGINPFTVILLSICGAVTGMIILMYVGGKLRDYILKKIKNKHDKKDSRLVKIWEKYGAIGLGVIGPVIVGSPIIAVIGLILNVDKRKLILFSTIGIFLKAASLAAAAYLGLTLVKFI